MSHTVPDEIVHLDFDVDEQHQEPCRGYFFKSRQSGEILKYNQPCNNKPQLVAIRSCCGEECIFCVECYNYVCRYWSDAREEGYPVMHTTCGTSPVQPFVSVNWIR